MKNYQVIPWCKHHYIKENLSHYAWMSSWLPSRSPWIVGINKSSIITFSAWVYINIGVKR